jgi:hypothetical protein
MPTFPELSSRFSTKTTDFERNVTTVVNNLMKGKANNTDSVTLAANASTTTVTLATGLLTPTTVIMFMPTTAHAATEFGAGTMYVSSITATTFVITHVNNAQTDRTFSYARIG